MDVVGIIRNTLNTVCVGVCVCGQNTHVLNVKAGGIQTYRRALKGYVTPKVNNIAFSCLQRAE
jgi:hypothetical protein